MIVLVAAVTLLLLIVVVVLGENDYSTYYFNKQVVVSIWDETGVPAESYSPFRSVTIPPRYVVAQLTSSNANNNHHTSTSTNNIFHVTLDLGNSGSTLIAVQGCQSCSCPCLDTNKANRHLNCCPPKSKTKITNCSTNSCWPSSQFPKDYLETINYRNVSNINLNGSASGIHCPSSTEYLMTSSFLSTATATTTTTTTTVQCTMCFDNQDHSRTYVPATADHLVLLHYSDPSLHSNDTVIASVPLPYNFSFGALSQVMPPKDRIWSNIGLGYNSSFLQQLHITSIYFHLRISHHHHHHSPSYQEKSYLIFNPSKKHYYNSKAIPFRVEMNRKRLHPMLGFTIGTKSWTNLDDAATPHILPVVLPHTPLWFHIDSGNSGISINDTFVYEHLTHVTGGKWHEEEDNDRNDICTAAAVTTSSTTRNKNDTTTKRLYVPFPPFHAPPLRIWLTVDMFVDIPGPSWVLDTNGTTIFSTYVKNVLGLPFITNCDFIIDDRTTTLYVLTNNKMS
jgi:hypothetical protein